METSMRLRNKRIALIGILGATAVVFYIVESFVPRPLPWLRFGFGNMIILLSLYLLGFRVSLLIAIIKSSVGALLVGHFLTPSFLFSIAGTIASVLVMALLVSFPRNPFSPFGVSIAGAVFHNLAQLAVASFLFIGMSEALYLFPAFILFGMISGAITGTIALLVLRTLSRIEGWDLTP